MSVRVFHSSPIFSYLPFALLYPCGCHRPSQRLLIGNPRSMVRSTLHLSMSRQLWESTICAMVMVARNGKRCAKLAQNSAWEFVLTGSRIYKSRRPTYKNWQRLRTELERHFHVEVRTASYPRKSSIANQFLKPPPPKTGECI